MSVRFLFRLASEFYQQPACTGRKQFKVLQVHLLLFHPVDQQLIYPFKTDRPKLQNLRDVIRHCVNIGISKRNQGTYRRTVDQVHCRFQNGDARAFRTCQCSRDMKPFLWEQIVQIIS